MTYACARMRVYVFMYAHTYVHMSAALTNLWNEQATIDAEVAEKLQPDSWRSVDNWGSYNYVALNVNPAMVAAVAVAERNKPLCLVLSAAWRGLTGLLHVTFFFVTVVIVLNEVKNRFGIQAGRAIVYFSFVFCF